MTITIADGRGALWQWDTGRRVKITDGADVKQIHYQNRCFGCSVDVDVENDGTAIIPDELLQDYHTLTAYAYVTDDTGAYTMVQQDFAVYKRAKPADYVYTPTEHAGFDRLRAEIGDLADLTTGAHDTLVAAINEVALMGGRMSLRMADGYIQYSTDGGSTWTNLIAVSDLKGGKGDPGTPGKDGHSPVVTATKSGKTTTISVDGAAIATVEDGVDGDPGKDGAGMGITGATVGQIAKITAVDASGVPTAWSPVDMPSGGSADAVLYTKQTLTDAQKKQARENLDAASYFVITATQDSSGDEITLDKTIAQIQEAISAGKTPVIRIVFAGMSMYLQLITASVTTFIFGGVFSGELGGVLNLIFVGNSGVHHISKGLLSTNQNGELEQQTMAYPPVEDMQIATKKYVDDSIENGAGSSVQPDWNQNDDTQPDYVKNRPGGYIGETIVYSGTLPSEFGIIEQSFEIVEGKKYYVSTNDGEYIEYTAIKEEFSDGTIYYSFGSTTFIEAMKSSSAIDGKFLFVSTIVNGSTILGGASGEAAGTTYKVRDVGIVKIPQKYLDLNIDTKAAITVFASETNDTELYDYVQKYGSVIFYDDQVYNEKPTELYDFRKFTVFGAAAPYSYSIRRFMVCQNNLTPVIKILEYDSTNDTQKWKFTDIVYPRILMRSSTLGSKKQFEITVNDSGTLTATEVTK